MITIQPRGAQGDFLYLSLCLFPCSLCSLWLVFMLIPGNDDLTNTCACGHTNYTGKQAIIEIENARLSQHQRYEAEREADLQKAICAPICFGVVFHLAGRHP